MRVVIIGGGPAAATAAEELRERGFDGQIDVVTAETDSSDIRWGSWGESAGGEEHAEPVVVPVAVAAGEAAVEFDDPVHGLGAAVR